jgi:hypothetical protein
MENCRDIGLINLYKFTLDNFPSTKPFNYYSIECGANKILTFKDNHMGIS